MTARRDIQRIKNHFVYFPDENSSLFYFVHN